MAIPNPYPNIADDVKSDVTTYSSNKIESLISAATELPIPAAGDAGKVLTVNTGEDGYELTTPVVIDDTTASKTTVYSSDKVDDLLTLHVDHPEFTVAHKGTNDFLDVITDNNTVLVTGNFQADGAITASTKVADLGKTFNSAVFFNGFSGSTCVQFVLNTDGSLNILSAVSDGDYCNFSTVTMLAV